MVSATQHLGKSEPAEDKAVGRQEGNRKEGAEWMEISTGQTEAGATVESHCWGEECMLFDIVFQ